MLGVEKGNGYLENLSAARACALAASSVRLRRGAFVSSDLRRLLETAAISSTAARNAASLAFDGLLKPLTFRTNCSEAARISSSVTGGSKLKRVLMFLHMVAPRLVRAGGCLFRAKLAASPRILFFPLLHVELLHGHALDRTGIEAARVDAEPVRVRARD